MITRSQARNLRRRKAVQERDSFDSDEHADASFPISIVEKYTSSGAYGDLTDSSAPQLRRSGSSTAEFSLSDDNDGSSTTEDREEFEDEHTDDLRHSQEESHKSLSEEEPNFSTIFQHPLIPGFISHQVKGIIHDFCDNGLPWDGYQCRSLRAGGSGCLFALPCLFASHPLEQLAWLIQGFLSVWADYFHIHHASVAHGIDRIFANTLVVAMVWRAGRRLQWWTPALVVIPLAFFAGAHRAKKHENLEAWHWFHLGWHISASSLCCIIIHLMETCGPETHSFWSVMCSHESTS